MKGLPYLLLCYLALSGSVLAAIPVKNTHKTSLANEKTRGHFEAIGAFGIAKLNADNSTLNVTSSETDKLVQNNNSSWNTPEGQFGVGYVYYFGNAKQYSDHVQWFPSIEPELNIYQLESNSGISGNVWRFNSPAFNDLTYNMSLHSTRLMLDVALTVASWKQLSLYAIGGIGNAWNRSSYSDKTKPSDPCPEQRVSLSSNTNSSFAWEVGAGVAVAFNDRIGLSLEYLYTDLGKVRTSATATTGTITAPVTSPVNVNLQAQSALLGLHVALL